MFRRLLVAVDESEPARAALERAAALAERLGLPVEVVSVVDEPSHYATQSVAGETAGDAVAERFRAVHDRALALGRRAGIAVHATTLHGAPVPKLLGALEMRDADLLVVGSSSSSGTWDRFLGGMALQLVKQAPTSVLVVRPHEPGRAFKELLVGIDGSAESLRALHHAVELRRALDGTLRALAVDADATVTGARPAARPAEVEVVTLHGPPAAAMLAYADEVDADVIVVGATGRHGRRGATLGATAQHLVQLSRRAVLVVR